MNLTQIHSTADVSKQARIGPKTKIWHQSQVRENAVIGDNCIIGKNVYIDHDIEIGNNVKIQNNSSIYFKSIIEDGVFIGPHVCLTNDKNPRAGSDDGKLKTDSNWEAGKIIVKKGASIGAGSIILPDITIGEFAMIGAGSVVTKDVPDHALVYGNPSKMYGKVDNKGNKVKIK
jgi:UDP-2-acetamido-3-amino-2,3-dideoxy-glucuronate N-acetyltransferase